MHFTDKKSKANMKKDTNGNENDEYDNDDKEAMDDGDSDGDDDDDVDDEDAKLESVEREFKFDTFQKVILFLVFYMPSKSWIFLLTPLYSTT